MHSVIEQPRRTKHSKMREKAKEERQASLVPGTCIASGVL